MSSPGHTRRPSGRSCGLAARVSTGWRWQPAPEIRGRTNTDADVDQARQRRVVAAFLAAARDGDFSALLKVLDPDVVVRADYGAGSPLSRKLQGADPVARQALAFRSLAAGARPALVSGLPGFVVHRGDELYAVLAFTIRNELIAEVDIWGDRERLSRLG